MTTNPFKYSDHSELHTMFNSMVALQARVEGEMAKAKQLAGIKEEKFIPLESVKVSFPTFFTLKAEIEKPRTLKPADFGVAFQRAIDKIRDEVSAEIERVESKNAAGIMQNEAIKKDILRVMEAFGIPATYSSYEKSSPRSSKMVLRQRSAGYVQDIQRLMPVSNTSQIKNNLTYWYQEMVRQKSAYLAKLAQEEREREKDLSVKRAKIIKEYSNKGLLEALRISTGVATLTLIDDTLVGGPFDDDEDVDVKQVIDEGIEYFKQRMSVENLSHLSALIEVKNALCS